MESSYEPYSKQWLYLPLQHRTQRVLNAIENKIRCRILFAPKILSIASARKLKYGNIKKRNLQHILKYRPRTPRGTVNFKFIQKKDAIPGRPARKLQTNLHQSLIDALQQEKYALRSQKIAKPNLKDYESLYESEFETDENGLKLKRSQQKRKSREFYRRPSQTLGASQHHRSSLQRLTSAETSTPRVSDSGVKVIRRRKRSPQVPLRSPSSPTRIFTPGGSENYLSTSLITDSDHKIPERERNNIKTNKESFGTTRLFSSSVSSIHKSDIRRSNVPTSNAEALSVQCSNSASYNGIPTLSSTINSDSWDEYTTVTSISSIDDTTKVQERITVSSDESSFIGTFSKLKMTDKAHDVQSGRTKIAPHREQIFQTLCASPSLNQSLSSSIPSTFQCGVKDKVQSLSRPIGQPLSRNLLLSGRSSPGRNRLRTPCPRRQRQSTESGVSSHGFNAITGDSAASQPLPEYSLRCVVSASDIVHLLKHGRDSSKYEGNAKGRTKETTGVTTASFKPLYHPDKYLECVGDSTRSKNKVLQNNTDKRPDVTDSQTNKDISTCMSNLRCRTYLPGEMIRTVIRKKSNSNINEKLLTNKPHNFHFTDKDSFQSARAVKSSCSSVSLKPTKPINTSTYQDDIVDFPTTCFKHHFSTCKVPFNNKSEIKRNNNSKFVTERSPSNNFNKFNNINIPSTRTVSAVKKEISRMPFKDLKACLSYRKPSNAHLEMVLKNISDPNTVSSASKKNVLETTFTLNSSLLIDNNVLNIPFKRTLPKLPIIDLQERLSSMKRTEKKKDSIVTDTGSYGASTFNTDQWKTKNILGQQNTQNEPSFKSTKPIRIERLSALPNARNGFTLNKLSQHVSKLELGDNQRINRREIRSLSTERCPSRKGLFSRGTQRRMLEKTERMDEMIRLLYQRKRNSWLPDIEKKSKLPKHFNRRKPVARSVAQPPRRRSIAEIIDTPKRYCKFLPLPQIIKK